MDIIDFANQILEMKQEIGFLRYENARLKGIEEQYNQFVWDSINHSQKMIHGIVEIALTPGVLNALSEARKQGE